LRFDNFFKLNKDDDDVLSCRELEEYRRPIIDIVP